MNSKLFVALLVLGITTWAGINNFPINNSPANVLDTMTEFIPESDKKLIEENNVETQAKANRMGVYHSSSSRKLTSLPNFYPNLVGGDASSIANAAASALGATGLGTSQGGAAAALLGGNGLATSNADAAASVLGLGLSSASGNSAAAILKGTGLSNTNSNSIAGVFGGSGIGSGTGAAAAFGDLATSNTNTAVNVLGGGVVSALGNTAGSAFGNSGLAIFNGGSAANAIGSTGNAFSNGNAAATTIGGGFATGNTANLAFTSPGFSTSISNSGSLAIGNNAASLANANAASTNLAGGVASSGASANSAAIGAGLSLSGSAANAASATIGGNSFSTSKSASIVQGLGSNNLNGQYLFTVPTVTLTVSQDAFIFSGCNTYRVPIIRQAKNIRFGACEYQQSDCGYDHAYKLAQRLSRVQRYSRVGDGFAGYNNDDFEFFSVNERKVNKKRQVYSYFYEGEYDVQYPSYNIEVNNNQLYFQGHQDRPIDFEYSNDDSISFTKYFEKKRDFGLYDEDRAVADLFVSSVKVNRKGANNGYEFHDKKGRRLASCSPKKW